VTARYVALLRGVNIGRRQMPMADLREALEGLGFGGVATYLQSGNAVFESDSSDRAGLAGEIGALLADRFGFEVPVILRTADEMEALVELCPYPEQADADPAKVHVMFLEPMPDPKVWDGLDLERHRPEGFTPGDRALYLLLPHGMGRATLPAVLEKVVLPSVATTRNWRTVVNLARMVAGDRGAQST
jgi:uncharacterized protein (DUF1697 family)